MDFHMGQRVVCVDAGDNPYPTKGAIYTVVGFHEVSDQPGVYLAVLRGPEATPEPKAAIGDFVMLPGGAVARVVSLRDDSFMGFTELQKCYDVRLFNGEGMTVLCTDAPLATPEDIARAVKTHDARLCPGRGSTERKMSKGMNGDMQRPSGARP